MEQAQIFDVAIIGMGPVGATLANLLAGLGHSVVVLEREKAIFALPRAIHFDGECMRVFQNIGIAATLLPKIIPSPGMKFVDADGKPIITWERSIDLGKHAWCESYKFYQPELEQALREQLSSHPQVDVRLRHEVFSVEPQDDMVTLRFEDTATGKIAALSARYVVGCDGARSTVRRFMGVELDDLQSHKQWVVVDTVLHQDKPELGFHSIQYCDPKRPCTYSRGPGLRRRWEIMLVDGDDVKQVTSDAWLWQQLQAWITPDEAVLQRAALYTFHSVVAKKWHTGRLFIAGDAAHQTPPFMGQGMAAGIKDAANLAWKLAAVLSGDQDESLLATYDSERLPHAREFIATAVKLGSVIQDQSLGGFGEHLGDSLKNFRTPQPHLGAGHFHPIPSPHNGEVAPQSFLLSGERLDDIAPYQAVLLLHPDASTVDAACKPDVQMIHADSDSSLAYLQHTQARAVLIRPDRYVYGIAKQDSDIAPLLASWQQQYAPYAAAVSV